MGKCTTALIVWLAAALIIAPIISFGLSVFLTMGQLGLETLPQVHEAGLDAVYAVLFWGHFLTFLPMGMVLSLILVPIAACYSGHPCGD